MQSGIDDNSKGVGVEVKLAGAGSGESRIETLDELMSLLANFKDRITGIDLAEAKHIKGTNKLAENIWSLRVSPLLK